ncbi:aldehyde dehydrogenase [Hyphococcus luteus]|uniref:Aldehyde dehydrogenase PuuC n=1 Tax=Hyphococcus luteus TaxID=2058213 RepID=A0A2S7K4P8_9PROT|nr:aldehyde dehydrogenase [Marinicaulis flavus]PQA87472.1 aldehyde dehydrogenase PuuC [Marinicaulis flavus]
MTFSKSVAAALETVSLRGDAFINGEFRPAQSGQTLPCVTPIDGSEIARLAACDAGDIETAVAAARASFEAGHWRKMAPREKKKILFAFADKLEAHAEELALLETLDMGKPIANTKSADIPLVVQTVRYYAEAIDKVNDELGPSPHDAVSMIVREPLGVIGAVTPWNFPLLMASWKFAPALATGNSVVMKPAEQASLSMLRAAALAAEAGLPDGVLNVVPGEGAKAGKALALHMDVDGIVFTGSTAVGKLIMGYAAQSNLKRVALECGGKSPQIVMEDCPDFDAAADAAAWAVFYDQGQVCTAGTRLLVQNSIKDAFLKKVAAVAKDLAPGDPLDPDTKFGALVDETQMNTVLGYIRKGNEEGAQLVCGGERALGQSGGFYVEPTIFSGVDNKMTIAREEIFGPVISAIGFGDFDEAMTIANDTIYGLAAGIWTSNVNTAHRAARTLRAGNVWVNCWDGSDITTPFGGFKQSGFGRDRSLHALDKYTELKTVWMQLRD